MKSIDSKFEDIKAAFWNAAKELEDKKRNIEQERWELERAKEEFHALATKIEKVNFPPHIALDVGGQKFSTSLETLLSEKDSFFSKLFSGNWKLETKDGAYFLDRLGLFLMIMARDGTNFKYILNFLRDRTLPEIEEGIINELILEAEFYQLQGLQELLRRRKEDIERRKKAANQPPPQSYDDDDDDDDDDW